MRIDTCCEEETLHKGVSFLECKSMSFNSILGRAVPCRYIGNILVSILTLGAQIGSPHITEGTCLWKAFRNLS
jgi:hypothetical protein